MTSEVGLITPTTQGKHKMCEVMSQSTCFLTCPEVPVSYQEMNITQPDPCLTISLNIKAKQKQCSCYCFVLNMPPTSNALISKLSTESQHATGCKQRTETLFYKACIFHESVYGITSLTNAMSMVHSLSTARY